MRARNAHASRGRMPRAIVGIGGNLGARRAIFACAEALLAAQPGCVLRARSKLYVTPPLGPPQPDYLNAAFALDYPGDAYGLLAVLRQVEQWLGRMRRDRWGPRTIDLDLLHWSGDAILTAALTVPHAGLEERTFALAPLLDVAPELEARYGPILARLGGPPQLADPDWLQPFDAGAEAALDGVPSFAANVCISGIEERAGWAALLVSIVTQCGELT